MYEQHRIPATLAEDKALAQVRALVATAGSASRTEIGRRVCTLFEFRDARDRLQVASCMQALRHLERRGQIQLPAPRHGHRRCRPRCLGRPVQPPQDVPERVDQLRELALVEVRDGGQLQLWNTLVAHEHPCGAVQHAGAQLRYLLVSEHGVLGALGFAAAALAVAARDAFIGWDADTRSRQLHRVVGLSRFLIRPSVRCRNLASKALSLALRRLPDDFRSRYGYRPLLVETFVAPERHAGTSLAASNWRRVGQTAGRGRYAASGAQVPVKAVWLYPLAREWRSRLGVPAAQPRPVLGLGEGLAADCWAAQELGGAPLGDTRLGKRLVQIADAQAQAPEKSFPGAAQCDHAQVRGYYRFIDQPADSAVTPENMLAPHRQRTLERMRGQSAVLCIQDGTDLNFAAHGGCVGLGQIGRNKGSKGTLGLHMHSTLAVNGEGIPLGVPQIQYEAPDGKAQRNKPLEERKTMRWIRGLRESSALAGALDGVRPVAVMDREGDVYAVFAEQQRLGNVDLLVRAKHNRSRGKGQPKLFDWVRDEPVRGQLRIHVARLSARVATQRQAEQVLEWYGLRWRIEDWHRVLKTGCKVQQLAHRRAERIERAVTINALIAWRLTAMTLMGRDTPELPAETLFTEIELAVLEDFAQERRRQRPDNLGRAVLTLAMMGGYLNYSRKRYAAPGHQVLWEGYMRLAAATQAFERARRLQASSRLYQKLRSG